MWVHFDLSEQDIADLKEDAEEHNGHDDVERLIRFFAEGRINDILQQARKRREPKPYQWLAKTMWDYLTDEEKDEHRSKAA